MYCPCKEPSLNELMQEPIIQAVMECDAVRESDLRLLLEQVKDSYESSHSMVYRQ